MKLLLATGIVLLLFLASCTPTATTAEYGTEGLSITLTTGSNNVLYEETPARIDAFVENKGTSNVDHGVIVINLPESDFKKGKQLREELYLEPRTLGNPTGETRQYTFQTTTTPITDGTKQHQTLITAQACYQYTTVASPTVCLQIPGDKNPECKESKVKLSGQGAPLAITSVEATLIPTDNPERVKPLISITVANKGKGIIYDPETVLNACGSDSEPTLPDVILFEAFLDHSGRPLTCARSTHTGQTTIQLDKGTGTIVCEYAEGIPVSEGTHTSQILINVAYGYTSVATRTATIKSRTQ